MCIADFDGMLGLVSIVKLVCNVLLFTNTVYYRYVTLTICFLMFSIFTPSTSAQFLSNINILTHSLPSFSFLHPYCSALCCIVWPETSYITPRGCFAQFCTFYACACVHFTAKKINVVWSWCNAGQTHSHNTSMSAVVLEGMVLRRNEI